MAKRIKPNPYIVENIKQAEGAMAELAAIDRKIEAIDLEKQEAIDQIKINASKTTEALARKRKEIADGITVFAKMNKQELFSANKSINLGFGTIGFRYSSKLMQMNNVTTEMTLEKLHQFNFLQGIRVKEELNKEVLAGWPDERLETIGMKRQKGDSFFIEIDKGKTPLL